MTVLNLMLGQGRGGLEQAGVDYAEALAHAGLPALTVTRPGGWAGTALGNLPHRPLHHWASWDPLAILRLRQLAGETAATAIICHGNRALRMALPALKGRIPVLAVTHNYSSKRFMRADKVLCVTRDFMHHMTARGYPAARLFHVPNMVRIPPPAPRPRYRSPPVVATMGRFVDKKAFDLFIDAIRELKARNLAFKAVLGGDGEAAASLRRRAAGLEDVLTFTGWIADKSRFFDDADIFVLPSHHEPFGIVLIEAMAHGVPVVTTDSEGPREIVDPGRTALLTPRGSVRDLADALQDLLLDEAKAKALAQQAYRTVSATYSLGAMAGRLTSVLAKP
jgi:glycosyltransferase involved in cell wall biosynthesis